MPPINVRTSDVITAETVGVTFDDFLIKPALLRALKDLRFLRPSPVQLKTIPKALEGLDLLVQAKSGTGKTLAFGLVILQQLAPSETALILAPTREIALQTEDEISRVGWHLDPCVKVRSFIGGTPETSDAEKCADCQIFVGTPGRVLKLLRQKRIPRPLRFLVLDEADKLLDEGFREAVNSIIEHIRVADSTQFLAVSATFPAPLVLLAEKLLNRGATGIPTRLLPEKVFLCASTTRRGVPGEMPNAVLEGVIQCKFQVPGYHMKQKVDPLLQVLSCVPFHQSIVFVNNATQAMQVADLLNTKGVPSIATSSKQDQGWRRAALIGLKRFQYRVVVASDLWSRGVDVSRVDLVVNLDLPIDKETYLHRAGRCGRFGQRGLLINIVFQEDLEHLLYFQSQLELPLVDWVEKDWIVSDLHLDKNEETLESCIPKDTFDLKERRIDEDGIAYYVEDFIAQYGGSFEEPPPQWKCALNELVDARVDPADGNLYTKADFVLEYGGTSTKPPDQWLSAINPREKRIDVDGVAYTWCQFIEAYGGTLQEPPDQWLDAPLEKYTDGSAPQFITDTLEKPHSKRTASMIPCRTDKIGIRAEKSQETMKSLCDKRSLWQWFPPPPIPSNPSYCIKSYKLWMASLDYASSAQKCVGHSPLSQLWAMHCAAWRDG